MCGVWWRIPGWRINLHVRVSDEMMYTDSRAERMILQATLDASVASATLAARRKKAERSTELKRKRARDLEAETITACESHSSNAPTSTNGSGQVLPHARYAWTLPAARAASPLLPPSPPPLPFPWLGSFGNYN